MYPTKCRKEAKEVGAGRGRRFELVSSIQCLVWFHVTAAELNMYPRDATSLFEFSQDRYDVQESFSKMRTPHPLQNLRKRALCNDVDAGLSTTSLVSHATLRGSGTK